MVVGLVTEISICKLSNFFEVFQNDRLYVTMLHFVGVAFRFHSFLLNVEAF